MVDEMMLNPGSRVRTVDLARLGHLAVNLLSQDANLWRGHARSYFKTDGLFSTDHKGPDFLKSTKLEK